MHLTVMVLGALVPAELVAELATSLTAPALTRLLARAERTADAAAAPGLAGSDWLAREVFGTAPPAPTAPYARAALSGSYDARQVWHADPVHIAVGRESLIVQELGAASPAPEEADALIAAASALCAEHGCDLQRAGSAWFLSNWHAWSMRPQPLAAMSGTPMPLPAAGETDALIWSRLHNAIQMVWHEHPVNQAREREGRPAINGLWLHGGGHWAPLAPLRWQRVHSRDAGLRGAARAAGAVDANEDEVPHEDALLVWDDALAARRQMDWQDWIAAMTTVDRRLAKLPAAGVELVLTGPQRRKQWSARPTDRFRLWRRHRFAEALAE